MVNNKMTIEFSTDREINADEVYDLFTACIAQIQEPTNRDGSDGTYITTIISTRYENEKVIVITKGFAEEVSTWVKL